MGAFAGLTNKWLNLTSDNALTGLVTNGLVLALDAGRTISYSGSGTTWTDLSSIGNDATLVNGPSYSTLNSGSLVLDGIDDYILETSTLSDSFWQGNWTASFWVKFDAINTTTSGGSDKTLVQHGTSSVSEGLHLSHRNFGIRFGLYGNDVQGNVTILPGIWYNIVFTLNNSNYEKKLYTNGTLNTSSTGSGAYVGTGSNTKIGGVSLTFGETFDGNISSCSFYNRILTEEEIRQNYNVMRRRFGLGETDVVTDGLVLHLDAGDSNSYSGSGTTWTDLSGNGNNGTLTNGPTYSSSNGGSIVFDGTDDYIPLVDNFGDPQQFTIEFWVYPTELNIDANNNYRRLFIPVGASTNGSHSVLIEQGGNISFRVPGGTTTNMQVSGFSGINQWGHVVCTYDQSNKKIYFNGSLKSTVAEASVTVDFGSPQIVDPNGQTFKGRIANVKVYNRALTAGEIEQNFNAHKDRYGLYKSAIYLDGLVQYLDAESYSNGSTWYDLSGEGNNATLVGTITRTTDNGIPVLSLPGTTGNRIDASGPNLTSSNFTVICATRCTSTQNGRIVSGGANNWLLGHHDDEAYKYYAEGWVNNPSLNNQNGQEWRIYCGTGDIAGDLYSLYVNGEHIVTNSGGSAGPNGWSIGRYYVTDTQYTPAMISFLICYNRVLTTEEIEQNFQTFRERFGL